MIIRLSIILLSLWVAFFPVTSSAVDVTSDIKTGIARGQYIPTIDVSIKDMRSLPVPLSNENYAFLQSLDAVTNIVVGNFSSGERVITLIKDKNSDGEVDLVAHWYVDEEKFKFDPAPAATYPSAVFDRMKMEILNGRGTSLSPNPEGIEFIRILFQVPGNIQKWRTGYLVFKYDPDVITREMSRFSYSMSAGCADVAFEMLYMRKGTARISPVINQGVYCKNSRDAKIIEVVRGLLEETKRSVLIDQCEAEARRCICSMIDTTSRVPRIRSSMAIYSSVL
jgi:hypothetical protein